MDQIVSRNIINYCEINEITPFTSKQMNIV